MKVVLCLLCIVGVGGEDVVKNGRKIISVDGLVVFLFRWMEVNVIVDLF